MKYLLNNRITLFLEHHFLSFSLSFYDMPSMSVHDFPFATIAAAHNIIREGKFPHRSDIFSMSVFSLRSFKKPQIRVWYEFFFVKCHLNNLPPHCPLMTFWFDTMLFLILQIYPNYMFFNFSFQPVKTGGLRNQKKKSLIYWEKWDFFISKM